MSALDEPVTRLFFALVPPRVLQRTLGDLARDVARRAHGRPVPAENVHLTLAFIGAWRRSKLAVLADVAAAVRAAPMQILLDKQGGFRRAGIAWIAPSVPPSPLLQLAQTLADVLRNAGVLLEARAFHPHMTLARRCGGPCVKGAVGPFAWDVDAMALIASDTRAEGARYTALAHWPLR